MSRLPSEYWSKDSISMKINQEFGGGFTTTPIEPDLIKINNGSKIVLRITAKGKVELGEDVTADEAAMGMLDVLQQYLAETSDRIEMQRKTALISLFISMKEIRDSDRWNDFPKEVKDKAEDALLRTKKCFNVE